MISKYMTAALAGSALLATAAIAQTPNTTMNNAKTAPSTSATTSDSSYHGDWRASKVIGLNVYNSSNEKLGSIGELLFDKSGNIKAAVIGVGGFLGVGQHDVAVAFDKLKFVDTPVPSTSASTSSGSGMRPGTTTGAAPSTSSTATSTSSTTKSNPWYPDHAVFEATKDQLKSMPQFKYST